MTKRKGSALFTILAVYMLLILANVSIGEAAPLEYPSLYKSPRAMGMGGAGVSIGGQFDSVFYNPAGLGKMPDNNWEVNLGQFSAAVGENVIDFANDMQDAFDSDDDEQLNEVNQVLSDYRGDHLHMSVSDLVSVAKRSDNIAFGIGALGSGTLNAVPNQGLGDEGLLYVQSSLKYGGIGGMSYRFSDNLYLGASLKYMQNEAVDYFFTATELVENEDDLEDYILNEVKEDGSSFGIDAGVIYEFMRDSKLKPAVGLSVLNIGDMDFGDAGEIPMTVNLGASINPEIPYFHSFIFGIDYVDLLKNYEEDDDFGKRLRLGGELGIFDKKYASMAVRAGLYQGYGTFGADLRIFILTMSYTSYAEEVGAYAGQDKDRRHLVTLNLGW